VEVVVSFEESEMEKLNVCLSNLKAVKDGHVSKSRVDAVAEAAIKALKQKTAGEVADALVLHATSSTKDQRLAAVYALHACVWMEKKKLEDKNSNHRTEKRGSLSIALEQKIESVMALIKDSSLKDKEQVAKILQKWSERFVFPNELCRRCAQAADCAIPVPPRPTSPPPTASGNLSGSMSLKQEDTSAVTTVTSSTASSSAPAPVPIMLSIKPTTAPAVSDDSKKSTTVSAAPPPLTGSATTTSTTGAKSSWSAFVRGGNASNRGSTNGGNGDDRYRSDDRRDSRDRDRERERDRRRSPDRRDDRRDDRRGSEKRSRWDQ
jgi:hypothetical protein